MSTFDGIYRAGVKSTPNYNLTVVTAMNNNRNSANYDPEIPWISGSRFELEVLAGDYIGVYHYSFSEQVEAAIVRMKLDSLVSV